MVKKLIRFFVICLVLVLIGSCVYVVIDSQIPGQHRAYVRDDVAYQKPQELDSEHYFIDQSQVNNGYILCYLPANWYLIMEQTPSGLHSTTFFASDETKAHKIPLSYGNGEYKFTVVSKEKYTVETVIINASNLDENVIYTMSNDIVNFSSSELVSKIASDLFKKSSSDYDYLSLVVDYIHKTITYDYDQRDADMFLSIDNILAKGTGVCYEHAKLLTALMRVKNIPCKLVFGDFGPNKDYHAWCEVTIDGKSYIADPTSGFITTIDDSRYSRTKVY